MGDDARPLRRRKEKTVARKGAGRVRLHVPLSDQPSPKTIPHILSALPLDDTLILNRASHIIERGSYSVIESGTL